MINLKNIIGWIKIIQKQKEEIESLKKDLDILLKENKNFLTVSWIDAEKIIELNTEIRKLKNKIIFINSKK